FHVTGVQTCALPICKGSYWDFGIGVQWYNFKLGNRNYQIISGDEGIEFINRTDVNGFKSKMSASYLTALTLFRWDFGKMNDSGQIGRASCRERLYMS